MAFLYRTRIQEETRSSDDDLTESHEGQHSFRLINNPSGKLYIPIPERKDEF
jgi:hypothetical protein